MLSHSILIGPRRLVSLRPLPFNLGLFTIIKTSQSQFRQLVNFFFFYSWSVFNFFLDNYFPPNATYRTEVSMHYIQIGFFKLYIIFLLWIFFPYNYISYTSYTLQIINKCIQYDLLMVSGHIIPIHSTRGRSVFTCANQQPTTT